MNYFTFLLGTPVHCMKRSNQFGDLTMARFGGKAQCLVCFRLHFESVRSSEESGSFTLSLLPLPKVLSA